MSDTKLNKNNTIPILIPKKIIDFSPIFKNEFEITRKTIKAIAQCWRIKYRWWRSKNYNRNVIIATSFPPPPKFKDKFFKVINYEKTV